MNALDPLSDVFRLLDARSIYSGSFVTGGRWAVRFQPTQGIKFNALGRGSAWLAMEAQEPVLLYAGDCFITCHGNAFVVASELDVPEIGAESLFANARGEVRYGEREDVQFIGGLVMLNDTDASMLTGSLPPLVVVRASTARALPIRWLLDQLLAESRADEVGRSVVCNDLMRMMFVHALRAHLESDTRPTRGWLAGMVDRRIRVALRRIHEDPARSWPLVELASAAAMSRSAFAQHFKETTGLSPGEYAIRWRMRLAMKRLRDGSESASVIGASLGYLSDSAFSAAFKKVVGVSPRAYRAQAEATLSDRR
jgi:AraC-like DNA-binding protein